MTQLPGKVKILVFHTTGESVNYLKVVLTSSKGMPFVQANIQYGISGGISKSSTSTGASSETKTKPKGDWNAGATFGYEHFVSQYVGLYGSIGFNYGKSKTSYEYRPSTGTGYDYTSEYSRFYIPVNFGLQVHLPSKGKK